MKSSSPTAAAMENDAKKEFSCASDENTGDSTAAAMENDSTSKKKKKDASLDDESFHRFLSLDQDYKSLRTKSVGIDQTLANFWRVKEADPDANFVPELMDFYSSAIDVCHRHKIAFNQGHKVFQKLKKGTDVKLATEHQKQVSKIMKTVFGRLDLVRRNA